MEKNKIKIFCDGGSRGNPGPAGIGIIIGDKKYGEYIGEATNNIAEYKAVIFALKKTKQLLGRKKSAEADLEIRVDSELLFKQMNAEYKILDKKLQPLFIEVWNLKQDFKKVEFIQIKREDNAEADLLVNRTLNSLKSSLFS
ncbi:MAG: ribonuclease HI family protein [Candidatus Liptonbacteria bacterium]|nr:ribonuclease HI family protein [Candidatus Liptonbacteria bacterium]